MAPPASSDRERVGPFELGSVLGAGGMGVVYRGKTQDGRTAAVKVLHATLGFQALRRFEREANIRIDHPNVVQVLDAGIDSDGTPYIAFELLEGESFRDRLSRRPLTSDEAIHFGVQICRGLSAAHRLGITHRDLKPENLLCLPDGLIKILDFGIAQISEIDATLTKTGTVLGTAAYLSPEQAKGQGEVDARTDVWALGVVLYEALTGRSPFLRDGPLPTIMAVLTDEPASLTRVNSRVPASLAEVIHRALSKPKQERWASTEAMALALEACELDGRGGPTVPPASIVADERRVVAVILAEEVVDIAMIEGAVFEHGGALLPLVGGRALALFGGVTWHGDEIQQAAAAAVLARAGAKRMALASGYAHGSGFGISGEALTAAEEACRAELAGVAVHERVARELSAHFESKPPRDGLIEIVRARPEWSATSQGEYPLVGRDTEMAQLRGALETVLHEGRSVVALVTGPVGVGKSRLRREFLRMLSAVDPSGVAFIARADTRRSETALSLMSAAIASRLGLHSPTTLSGDPNAATVEGLSPIFDAVHDAFENDSAAHRCSEFLAELVGIAAPISQALVAARAEPALMAEQLRFAIVDYISALVERGPVALVLDDLQWADRVSLELIEDLAERLADAPLLVFAAARPELTESHPELFAGREVVRVDPRPLRTTDVARLAESIVGSRLDDHLVDAVHERTAGNALFVEQIALELRDRNTDEPAPSRLPSPLTVKAAIQSRLDQLPSAEKDLCKRAAVLGRPFTATEIESLGAGNVEPLLASLRRRGLLAVRRRTATADEPRHRFRSTLVAEVVYDMLGEDIRVELHGRAAAHFAEATGADPEELARHYDRARQPQAAATQYALATLSASRRGDADTVLRCSDRAFHLDVDPGSRFALHMARADVFHYRGSPENQAAELDHATAHAQSDTERARILTEQAVMHSRRGAHDEALVAAEGAVAAALLADDQDALAMALGRRGAAQIYSGRLMEARRSIEEASSLSDTTSARMRAIVAGWRAQLASATGDLGARREAFADAARWHHEAGAVRRAAGAESNLADAYNRFGAYAESEEKLRTALEGCRQVANRSMEGYTLLNLGYSLTMLGRRSDALEALDEARKIAIETKEARLAVLVELYEGRARLDSETAAQVGQSLRQTATEAERIDLMGVASGAFALCARAHLLLGDPVAALDASTRAIKLRDALGGLEEDEAEVFLVHAEALSAAGREEDAMAVRQRGRNRLAEIARSITDAEWRRRFLEDVEGNRRLMGS